jgi:multiple sugar transport system substrate-binding protein
MKPGILIFLGLLAAPLARAAEGGAETVLTVWNRPPVARVNERRLWDREAAEFEAKNPKVRIRAIARDYVAQQFVTVMAGGKGPDVVHLWVGGLPTLAKQNFLSPLDDLIKHWDQKDLVPDLFWEPARLGGKTWGVPSDSYFYTLLIRRDLYVAAGLDPERPPANWDELLSAAKKMTRPERSQAGFGFSPKANFFLDFVWQAGGEFFKKGGSGAWEPAFQENQGVAALSFLTEMRFKHGVMQPNPLASEDELKLLFASGKLAMMPGVANQMPDLITRFGMSPADLLIAPLPAGPTGLQASHSGGDYFIINARSEGKKREAAWAYIRHVLSPINQLSRWDQMKKLEMPIFPGAFSVATDLTSRPEFKLVKDALGYARNEPNVENWPRIKDYLETMVLERAFTDGGADLSGLLNDAARVVSGELL